MMATMDDERFPVERLHGFAARVFQHFGVPAGDRRFAPPAMPIWIDFGGEVYGVPDLENRGFKVGPDRHGPAFDPDSGERVRPSGPASTA